MCLQVPAIVDLLLLPLAVYVQADAVDRGSRIDRNECSCLPYAQMLSLGHIAV